MRLYVITMGFANAETIHFGLKRLADTTSYRGEIRRVFVDQHYPIKYKQETIKAICDTHGFLYLDAKQDMGLHRGLNFACASLPLENDDLILIYDPDTYVCEAVGHNGIGFDEAMVDSLNAFPELQYVASWNEAIALSHNKRVKGLWRVTRKGTRIFVPRPGVDLEMMNLSMHRWSFIRSIGGFNQPRPYYGFLEHMLWNELLKRPNQYMGFIRDFQNRNAWDEGLIDKEYADYKIAHASCKFDGSFAEFLAAGQR